MKRNYGKPHACPGRTAVRPYIGAGRGPRPCGVMLLAALLAVAGCIACPEPSLAQSAMIKGASDMSQPATTYPPGTIKVYALAAGKACTTKAYPVSGFGAFSMQVWDSVLTGTGNVDTVIINIRFQCANYDSAPFYNMSTWHYGATLLTDSIVMAADTLIASTTAASKKRTFGVDFSDDVPRCAYIRYIILNNGPDAVRALKVFPYHGVQF